MDNKYICSPYAVFKPMITLLFTKEQVEELHYALQNLIPDIYQDVPDDELDPSHVDLINAINIISSCWLQQKYQEKDLDRLITERRAGIENAWFNNEISDQQLEAEYKALGIVNKCNKLPQ